MEPRRATLLTVILSLALGATLSADRVKLRSGQSVEGSFMSADVKVVRLLLANGTVAELAVDEISAVPTVPGS